MGFLFFPTVIFFPLLNTVILRFLFYHNFQVTLCIFWKHLSLPNEVHKLKKEKKDCCVPSWVLYPGLEKKDHNDSTSLSEAWYYYSKFPFLYFFSPVSPSSFHPGMEKKIIKHVDPTSKQKLSLIQICYQNLQNKQIITCPLANPYLISCVDNISDVFDLFTIEKYDNYYQHLKINLGYMLSR